MTKKEWSKLYERACGHLGHMQAYVMYLNRSPDIVTPELLKDANERVSKAAMEVDRLTLKAEKRGWLA